MFTSIESFLGQWESNQKATRRILDTLTDESLSREIMPGHRNLGRIAWHMVISISEMAGRTGLKLEGPGENSPMPEKAGDISAGYEAAAASLGGQISKEWTDESLQVEDDMYGERWKRGLTLMILLLHEVHHRGQMTVLMRQAGLKIPGVMGPSAEEWAGSGMEPPQI